MLVDLHYTFALCKSDRNLTRLGLIFWPRTSKQSGVQSFMTYGAKIVEPL